MICVERPEPSMPSITIRLPVISLGSNPTRGSPKKYFVPLSSEAGAGFGGGGGGGGGGNPPVAGNGAAGVSLFFFGVLSSPPPRRGRKACDRFFERSVFASSSV